MMTLMMICHFNNDDGIQWSLFRLPFCANNGGLNMEQTERAANGVSER